MKHFLQGRPFGHPLHTYLVHFPIGLYLLGFASDVLLFFDDSSLLVQTSFYSMAGASIMAIFAAVPGLADYLDIRKDHPAKKTASLHMALNVCVVLISVVNLVIRYPDLEKPNLSWVAFALSFLGIVVLSFSGYLGGSMVYDSGIGVGRHRRKTALPDATIKVSRSDILTESPRKLSPRVYYIADSDNVKEGETLRVDLDGEIIVITKLEGKLYGFQEFCTHRFGPLSEGCLQDGQITCPWHQSKFDVKTGKPVDGPAKVDLKTYNVKINDGKICVELPPVEK